MRVRNYLFLGCWLGVFSLCLVSGAAWAQEGQTAAESGAPVAVMESQYHEFAHVLDGEKVEHTFIIRNKGDAELVIERINTG